MLSFEPYPKVLYASLIPDLLPNRKIYEIKKNV